MVQRNLRRMAALLALLMCCAALAGCGPGGGQNALGAVGAEHSPAFFDEVYAPYTPQNHTAPEDPDMTLDQVEAQVKQLGYKYETQEINAEGYVFIYVYQTPDRLGDTVTFTFARNPQNGQPVLTSKGYLFLDRSKTVFAVYEEQGTGGWVVYQNKTDNLAESEAVDGQDAQRAFLFGE